MAIAIEEISETTKGKTQHSASAASAVPNAVAYPFYTLIFAPVVALTTFAGSTLLTLALWSDSIHADLGNENLLYAGAPGAFMCLAAFGEILLAKKMTEKEKIQNVGIVLFSGFLFVGLPTILLQLNDHPGRSHPVVSGFASVVWSCLFMATVMMMQELPKQLKERNAYLGTKSNVNSTPNQALLGEESGASASDPSTGYSWELLRIFKKPYELAKKAGTELKKLGTS